MANHVSQLQTAARSLTQTLRQPAGIVAAVAVLVAVLLGTGLAGERLVNVMAAAGVALVVFVGLKSPFAALTLFWVLIALVPLDGYMLGIFVPNLYQLFCPVLMLSTLLGILAVRGTPRVQVRAADAFVLAFAFCGYVGAVLPFGRIIPRDYLNKIAGPLLLYFFFVRFIPMTPQRLDTLMKSQLAAVTLSAVEGRFPMP